ncbi:hypothetical protein [Bryobacter aggregatus]|uniref:hypothetical protein n=1 Tax=Bryobacter aggregatus TaxID=360054 RepID=UPI00055BFEC6|nr:hypothetical protein [Bryobacter aggregatus]
MANPDLDLTAYALGDATPAETEAALAALAASPELRDEFERLQYTLTALHGVREEEIPRRIAFVSDPVFAASWWQRLLQSGPRLGFAGAGLLAAAITAHGFLMRPVPTVVQAPAPVVAALSQTDIDAAVAKAVKEVEGRQQKQFQMALAETEKRHATELQMMSIGFRENLDLVRKQMNMMYVSSAKLTVGGSE